MMIAVRMHRSDKLGRSAVRPNYSGNRRAAPTFTKQKP